VNSMIKTIVEYASRSGIPKIVYLRGVREEKHSSKMNAMINNFRSFDCIKRFREKAGEHGIEVR